VQNVISYDVVIRTDNSELLLKPGMTATAHIVLDEHDNVLRLPQQALRFEPAGTPAAGPQPDEAAVWALRDSRLVRVPVTLGLSDDSYVEVTGGLEAGDQIVTGERPAQSPGS